MEVDLKNIENDIRPPKGFKVFDSFNNQLLDEWQKLYDKGGNYNISPEWCQIWFKYFGKKNRIQIITFWENKELKLLAPFYVRKNKLTLIGTKPDMYDEFNILFEKPKHVDRLVEYIFNNGFQINFKHVNSDSQFAKSLMRIISSRGIKHYSQVSETKPFISEQFTLNSDLRRDINRCNKNILKNYDQEYLFNFNIEKSDNKIEQFIKFHTERWNGGMLVKKANLIEFLNDVLKNSSSVILSELLLSKSKETVAYGIGYMDSANSYWYSMPAYNVKYKNASPGKVLVFNIINKVFEGGSTYFDFGRGSEPYKAQFTQQESVLFNITTYNNRYYFKILNLVNKILDLIYS